MSSRSQERKEIRNVQNKPLSTCPRGHKRNENLEISGCFQNKPLSTCPQGHKKEEKLEISICFQNKPLST